MKIYTYSVNAIYIMVIAHNVEEAILKINRILPIYSFDRRLLSEFEVSDSFTSTGCILPWYPQ